MPAKTTSKNAKNVKNTKVAKNKVSKKVEVKETTTPVTPPVTETPVQAETPVETTTPYLEEFTAVVSELDNVCNFSISLHNSLNPVNTCPVLEYRTHSPFTFTATQRMPSNFG